MLRQLLQLHLDLAKWIKVLTAVVLAGVLGVGSAVEAGISGVVLTAVVLAGVLG